MPKRLRFFIRYITAPYRLRRWLNGQTVVVFLLSALFLTALVWTTPPDQPAEQVSQAGQSAAVQDATSTPLPGPTRAVTLSPEYLSNSEQTIGITLVGAVLVLIVVMGVLIFQPRDHE